MQLKGAKESLSKSFSKNHVDDLVNEKDSQISGLLEEGEKLSKQQLTLNTTIKKLRTRVKDSEEKLKNLEEKNNKNEENLQKKTEEFNTLQVISTPAISNIVIIVIFRLMMLGIVKRLGA